MAKYIVPDISYAQGSVDWPTVAAEFKKGTFHAIILRCGYGNDEARQDDTQWAANVAACERYGIPYAAYLYSYAYTQDMARSEAQHVLRLVKGHKPWTIYYDLEEAAYGRQAKAMADVFCPIIQQAGYRVGVYTYESYFNSFMKGYTKYPIWIARYSSIAPRINAEYEAWQYTSTGIIPGFAKGIDLSFFYKKLWSTPAAAETKTSTKVSTQQTVVDKAVEWMENIANDNSHGYDQRYRWGEHGDFDCSSMVISAWELAGVKVKTDGATYTGNMRRVFLANGFRDVTASIDLTTGSGLKRGDVLLNDANHTAMAISAGKLVQASINEKGGVSGGKPGDQTGREIGFCGYYNYPWNCILRFGGASATRETTVQPVKAAVPLITYGIKTRNHGIMADVGNGAPAGFANDSILGIKIGVTSGKVQYRVHCGGRWLPKVTGNSWNDRNNGYAGDDIHSIDAIQIYFETDPSKTGGAYYEAVYSVKPYDQGVHLAAVHDTNWEAKDGDHTAGIFWKPLTEIKIKLKKC